MSGRQTNNRAEIEAARYALEQAANAGHDNVRVHTDSQFLKNCTEKWMPNWKQNDWRTASGEPVKNRSELQQLDRQMQQMNDVQFVSNNTCILNFT